MRRAFRVSLAPEVMVPEADAGGPQSPNFTSAEARQTQKQVNKFEIGAEGSGALTVS